MSQDSQPNELNQMMDEIESPEARVDAEGMNHGQKRTESQRSSSASAALSALPPKPKKKFTKRVEVWKYFDENESDPRHCTCKYCGIVPCCDTMTVGTSPMRGHISRCKLFKAHEEKEKQKVLSSDSGGNMKVVKFDPALYKKSITELVVTNELPFSFIETEGWKRFCFNMLPMYQTYSRRTCTRDVVNLYHQEKQVLKELFSIEKQRVSLTTDIWVSSTTSYNYMVVTAHWIDSTWKLQKRILSFKMVTDHKGETICEKILECMDEWGIEKIFTVTLDNASANEKALRLLKNQLKQRDIDALVLGGEFLHMRCCAHILNLVVSDGLKKAKPSIQAVRNALKYVRSSFTRMKSFELRCETGKISRRSLPLDCCTRWNSTYLMLNSALKVRGAFDRMLLEDKLYCVYFNEEDETTKQKRVGPPLDEDWEDVSRLVKFLKIFYKSTLAFSASTSVTSTVCYTEIVNIEKNLISKSGSSEEYTRNQALMMRDKFDKYWDGLMNMNPLVIIASVFDPRNKMEFASLCFEQLYGPKTIETRALDAKVSSALRRLFEDYSSRLHKTVAAEVQAESETTTPSQTHTPIQSFYDDDDDDELFQVRNIYTRSQNDRRTDDITELDVYLSENTEVVSQNNLGLSFDVLSWWRANGTKFPILAELARDVLSIQVSSVASESAFSTSGRVLDPYRSSLTPFMVEVLVCLQQWLRCGFSQDAATVANVAHMLDEYDFFDSLDSRGNSSSARSVQEDK